ncbi:amidohydrolase family protein [Olivibacter ginsenosidimutans]|uniref:Amidohydrolase family protein n=1 Tax=Olivibacter ginsenosidimutans TaxID=1176537 RepID=A0ABP9BY41_9SPHI
MERIDAHQHFWNYDPVKDTWITGNMAVIQRSFLPADLAPLLRANGVSGCIAVQADQSLAETHFLLDLAKEHPFIKGVVGWVDLKDVHIEEKLAHLSLFPRLKGFRHILEAESDPHFMLSPTFIRGVAALYKFDFSYDLLVKPKQLHTVIKFMDHFSMHQRFVIDHLAKPYVVQKKTEPWASEIKTLAKYPNLYCKLSGMVTEAHWKHWKASDFTFYINHLLDTFGPERLLFGSDWPVCLLAAQYEQVVELLDKHLTKLSVDEQEMIWCKNAERFYRL